MLIEANSNNFEEVISEGTVLVKFSTPWCVPCKKLNPILQEMSNEGQNIVLVDIEDSPDLGDRFQVMSVPTMILFKNGEVDNRMMGFKTKEQIIKEFNLN